MDKDTEKRIKDEIDNSEDQLQKLEGITDQNPDCPRNEELYIQVVTLKERIAYLKKHLTYVCELPTNGTQLCTAPAVWDAKLLKCKCDSKSFEFYNDSECIECKPPASFNETKKDCDCPIDNQFWSGK